MQQSSATICLDAVPEDEEERTTPHHDFKFTLDRPGGTIVLKLSTPKGVELAQAVLDVKVLRDGGFALWALADDGAVQSTRWFPDKPAWQVRCAP